MALTLSTFGSFDEVVYHYNNITPLRGRDNVGKDIRPIGDRARKYERIVKISPSCYALSDGYHMGDEYFLPWLYHHRSFTPTLTDMEKHAPIVWRKKRDGTEEVTLRNGWGPYTHTSRYAFLWRHTPYGMLFKNSGNGTHFITLRDTDKQYYLAKTRTTPRPIYDGIKANKSTHYWQIRRRNWATVHDDNSALVFRKTENGWEHVEGTGRSLDETKRPTVNKNAKAKYKDDIKKFFEWGMSMSPLLPLENAEYRTERSREFYKYFNTSSHHSVQDPKNLRRIVREEDHPLRLALWVGFAGDCTDRAWGTNIEYYCKTVRTKEDLQRVRSRYNAFVNKHLGFMEKKGH